ncbi:DEAD box helicase, putative [Plasmodium gallinaceum]|uniref:ATP-dependent RNA helicase n=1 Tax=Plasmodium gallinaceum TaxID=5849 RepID=A0A1J1GYC3_PLAGA|nr:DEAD box helicase, putative [Plasmodium gallinaceum]CRG97461.1 DEAD box helicase, putative [Plasmodium gallinaceum]
MFNLLVLKHMYYSNIFIRNCLIFEKKLNYSFFYNNNKCLHLKRTFKINENKKNELLKIEIKNITYISKKIKNNIIFYENSKYFSINTKRNFNIEHNNNQKKEKDGNYTNEIFVEENNKKTTSNNDKKEDEKILIENTDEIDEDIKKSLLEVFKYKEFTDVQKIIYKSIIKEKKKNDLLVQAKTGTGKTISYLLLVINDILKNKILSVHTLIIVPTRELANQIYNEAKLLLTYKNNINVLTLTGGTKRREDQINIRRVKPDIIICTVGRLLDHFECTYLFNTLFHNLRMLIIDEADQLLSFGYQNDINRILSYLPKNRRNFLFSATLSHNLDDIRKNMCKSDYIFLNCIKDTTKHTNDQLKQFVIFHKAIDTTVILYNLLIEHMRLNQFTYKIIVFFPTARATSFYATFFKNQMKISVYEIHRKKEPTHRQITSNRFYMESVGILFTSDISSRGINYPDVTLIIQVNCAISREQYIHRVGRTARSNKEGMAIILLNEADELFYEQIKDLNIEKINSDEYTIRNTNVSNYLNSWMSNTQLLYLAYAYYSSLLRFYKTKYTILKLSDDDIIDVVNSILLSTGLVEQPHISSKLAATLNMQSNPKLKIRKDLDDLLL